MDTLTTYKIPRRIKPDLLLLPPYCRRAEKDKSRDVLEMAQLRLEVSDPSKILSLCETLTDDNTRALEVKLNKYFQKEGEADSVFFITLHQQAEEAVVRVVGTKALPAAVRADITPDVFTFLLQYKDDTAPVPLCEELQKVVKTVIQDKHFTVSAVPVVFLQGCKGNICGPPARHVFFLICFINTKKTEPFIVKLVQEAFRFCLAIFKNTIESEEEARIKEQCQTLLAIARKLFLNLSDLSDLLEEIMMEARRLTNAERCSLFLLDPDHMHLVAKVFDGVASSEVRIAKDQGIAGHVAATGKILNIKNAYDHPLFYRGVDEATGFRTRNILCFPIKDDNGVVGVAQLCNKKDGAFDYFDEEVANAFGIYCGLSIVHSLMYKRIHDAQARSKLSNELMMYHMRVSSADVVAVICCPTVHEHRHFDLLTFNPRYLQLSETVCYVLQMFTNLGFIQKFNIKTEVLTKFLLYAQKGYREPKDAPYHNWMHAVTVAHFSYATLKSLKLVENGYLTHLEALMYLVSSICHDIDHRGTTSSFQLASDSALASLYSSEGSVMERHHLAQTLCILNTEGCNFLEVLNQKEYTLCLDILKDLTLATDLQNHISIFPRQFNMAQVGYNKCYKEHRYLFLCLLMTCADLCDQTKDWKNTKNTALLIYSEFFRQGDMEKNLGKQPLEMMDRDKASIPDLQTSFLREICLPLYQVFAKLMPDTQELLDNVVLNLKCWELSKDVFEKYHQAEKNSMEILASKELEDEVLTALEGESQSDDEDD